MIEKVAVGVVAFPYYNAFEGLIQKFVFVDPPLKSDLFDVCGAEHGK